MLLLNPVKVKLGKNSAHVIFKLSFSLVYLNFSLAKNFQSIWFSLYKVSGFLTELLS